MPAVHALGAIRRLRLKQCATLRRAERHMWHKTRQHQQNRAESNKYARTKENKNILGICRSLTLRQTKWSPWRPTDRLLPGLAVPEPAAGAERDRSAAAWDGLHRTWVSFLRSTASTVHLFGAASTGISRTRPRRIRGARNELPSDSRTTRS